MTNNNCLSTSDNRLVGDPVDTFTGAVVDRKLEFRLTGPLELWWYRHYDSAQSHRSFSFGWGHTHEFDRTLHFSSDKICYQAPVGREYTFPALTSAGDEIALHGFVLRRLTSQTYELNQHAEPSMLFQRNLPQRPARLTRIYNQDQEILFHYNSDDLLTHIVDSAGRIICVEQMPDGRLISLTLENKESQSKQLLAAYEYDERGNLVATQYGSGYGYRFTYDDQNRMLMRRGRMGFEFHYTYDDQGRCIYAAGDDQLYGVTMNYQTPGRLTKVTRADGGTWAYHFSSKGKLSKIIDPLDGIQQFIYDEKGLLALEVDPNQNATRLIYNSADAPITKVAPFDYPISLPEDQNRANPHINRVAANPVEYEYGRLIDVSRIILPNQSQLHELPLQVGARNLVTVRPETKQNINEFNAPFDVTPLGILWWPKPRYGRIFNEFGKLTDQRDEFGRKRHWEYDGSGNVVDYTDFDGSKWTYDNGTWHLLRGVTNPLGDEICLTYTTNGRVATCVDAGGALSEYRYDFKDNLVEVRRHGVVRDRYKRDAVGNLIAKHAEDGSELLKFEIGPGNLRTKRTLASGDEHTFQYDEFGRQINVSTHRDQVEFTYDDFGNLVLDKRNGLGVVRCYEGLSKSEELIYFDQFKVLYEWQDSNTRLITDPTGKHNQFQLLGNGLVRRHISNGSVESSQYDNQGRCLFKSLHRATGKDWNRRYYWSGEGELLRIEIDGIESVRHEYDAAHRLKRRFFNGTVENYELDHADNLITQPSLSNVTLKQGNRLATANGAKFEYNNRNHIACRQHDNYKIEYHYDSRDQLICVETEQGTWQADYDAIGRRVRKTWAGKTSEYYWNQDQLIAEISPSGRLRLYIYTDSIALTPFLIVDYSSIEAPPESGQCYFVFSDQIGSPCLIEDEQGKEVWRSRIKPYGEAEIKSAEGFECHFRFPGHYFDSELKLNYNRYRYYDPCLGRYIQSDPWGLAGGYNLYGYFPNPLLHVDVQGLGEEEGDATPCRDSDAEGEPPPGAPQPGAPRSLADMSPDELRDHVVRRSRELGDVFAEADPEGAKKTTLSVGVVERDGDPSTRRTVITTSADNQELPPSVQSALGPNEEGRATEPTIVRSPRRDNPDYDPDPDRPPDPRNNPKTVTDPMIVDPDTGEQTPYPRATRGEPVEGTQHHAEQRMERGAQDNNESVLAQQPTRPCCSGCRQVLGENGNLSKIPNPD
jgi:RHS repeat-associated protein